MIAILYHSKEHLLEHSELMRGIIPWIKPSYLKHLTSCSVRLGLSECLGLYLESREFLSSPQQLLLQLQSPLSPVNLQLTELQCQPLRVLPGRHAVWPLTNDRKSLHAVMRTYIKEASPVYM